MAATLLAFGVASAHFRRERTGRGGRVDTSLPLAALALQNNLVVRVESLDASRHAAFGEWLARAAEWKTVLDKRGVPASGVALPVEILDNPQPAANEMFHRFEHPALGTVSVFGSPVHLDEDGFTPGPPTATFGSEARTILPLDAFIQEQVHADLALTG